MKAIAILLSLLFAWNARAQNTELTQLQNTVSNRMVSVIGKARLQRATVKDNDRYPGKYTVFIDHENTGNIKDPYALRAVALVKIKDICKAFNRNHAFRNIESVHVRSFAVVRGRQNIKQEETLSSASIPVEALEKIANAPEMEIDAILYGYRAKGGYMRWASFTNPGFYEDYYKP
jgi:hypothetical protein